jgi:hypothetical protein
VVGVAVGDDDGGDVAKGVGRDETFDEGVGAGIEEELSPVLLEE